MKITAEIITIGDEILIGQIVNTNAVWLSQQLNNIGVWISKITTVGDNEDQILNSLTKALSLNHIIIITGGLGPTNDDITKKTLQKFYNTGLKKEIEVERFIKSTFEKLNVKYLPVHEQQAYILENSQLLFNNYGTAPGMWFENENKTVVVMPGVPSEMKGIVKDFVLNKIKKKYKLPIIIHKTIVTYGIPESSLSEMLFDFENSLPESIKLAYLPNFGSVRLRLSCISYNTAIDGEIERYYNKIINLIPKKNITAIEDFKPEEIVGILLKQKKQTLAVAESCTGGYISHLITSVPGSSEYFKGSVTAYENSVKMNLLGVEKGILEKYGAVSEQCVKQMAEGIMEKMDSDYSLSTSGIAGPSGATEGKPVGLVWIAVSNKNNTISKKVQLRGSRINIIQNASNVALEMLRQLIIDEK